MSNLTTAENRIIENLNNGIDIRFTGNGFNHSSVTLDGDFTGKRDSENNGWYTQKNNALQPLEAVMSVIAQGLVEVVITPVGGILVNENTLALTTKGKAFVLGYTDFDAIESNDIDLDILASAAR
jgi:hypothetical protein